MSPPFCGVTAFNYSDALNILSQKNLKGDRVLGVKRCIENIDIKTLDQLHIVPNMWPPSLRGIWFPMGYQDW
jgi:hypothetical protein